MKKFLLIGLSLFTIAAAKNSFAQQTFSFPKDTVRYAVQYNGVEDVSNNVKNETTSPLKINWKIVDHNMPTTWSSTFGLCDNVTCYGANIVGKPGTSQLTDTFSSTLPFKISMQFNNSDPSTRYVTVELKEGIYTDSMTFIMEKFPSNVNNVKQNNDGISLYPNPASDELNVRFSAAAGINYITVYNMIGKALTVYKVTASNSAKLDIQNLPSGIYFIRLSDNQGRIVATRKFTRQ